MLSYRHSFHAGNYADVLKHIVLIEVLEYLTKKDTAFDYIDTHAGAGLYDLRSEQAAKLQEYRKGIGQLKQQDWPELTSYFDAINKYNVSGKLEFYPGSPFIAAHFLRKQDRSWLYELHPSDAAILAKNTAKIRHTRVMHDDGFKGLLSLVPPISRRGLVLMDPAYEIKTDYAKVVDTLAAAYKKFPSGVYALWYPVVDRQNINQLERRLKRSGIKNIQQFELGIARDQFGTGMSASGMIVINPPWTLQAKMEAVLPKLVASLGGEGAFYRYDKLASE